MQTPINLAEVPEFYQGYVRLVPELDLIQALEENLDAAKALFLSIPDDKADYQYAEGKWSIKQLIQHLIDAERVMAYRAMRFARKDKTSLPGYNEDDYAAAANVSHRTLQDLIEEWQLIRQASIILFKNLDQEAWQQKGDANGFQLSVLLMCYVCVGHTRHHCKVLKERYEV